MLQPRALPVWARPTSPTQRQWDGGGRWTLGAGSEASVDDTTPKPGCPPAGRLPWAPGLRGVSGGCSALRPGDLPPPRHLPFMDPRALIGPLFPSWRLPGSSPLTPCAHPTCPQLGTRPHPGLTCCPQPSCTQSCHRLVQVQAHLRFEVEGQPHPVSCLQTSPAPHSSVLLLAVAWSLGREPCHLWAPALPECPWLLGAKLACPRKRLPSPVWGPLGPSMGWE